MKTEKHSLMTEQALMLLKHLKIVTMQDIIYACMVKPGLSGFQDRIDFLNNAKLQGNLK
jgi:hypothetical protein